VTRFQLLVLIIAAANAAVAIAYFARALVASHRARRRAPVDASGDDDRGA
jgi:NADH:ubiquinone oxidoreductase subunit K